MTTPVPGGGERGSAVVEFTLLAVLLMVPLSYLLLSVFQLQRAAYAVTGASREAGRAFVTASSPEEGEHRAVVAARVALADHGMGLRSGDLAITCSSDPCLTPGARVTVQVHTTVPLPYLPRIAGRVPASVAVHGQAVQVVDRYRAVRS